jgi:hypothetical protein
VLALCRALVADGFDPATSLHAYRCDVLPSRFLARGFRQMTDQRPHVGERDKDP